MPRPGSACGCPDVSVIGVDDHDMAFLFNLTTISQPVRQQGRLAAQILIEQIRNPTKLAPRLTVKSELIIRSSTGVVPNTTAARAG